jgi:hypothetical protein
MYATIDFKSKKALKEAVAAGQQVTIFQPNDVFGNPKASPDFSGEASLEGPHFPKPHSWYATVTVVNGVVTKVK